MEPLYNKFIIEVLRPLYYWHGLRGMEVTSNNTIPKKGGLIIASHHELKTDPHILSKFIKRRLNWIAASRFRGKSIFEFPILKRLTELLGVIHIDRNNPGRNKTIYSYITYLLSIGEAIVIFPEGNLIYERNYQKFNRKPKKGLIRIVKYAESNLNKKVPVYPVGIRYSKNGKKARLNIGEPIYLNGKPQEMKLIMDTIIKLST